MSARSTPRLLGSAAGARRILAVAPALIVLLLLSLLWLEPAAAQNAVLIPLEATINQNALMRQEISPPPTKQRSLRGRLREPIAGVPPEKLAEMRFTLAAVDFVGPSDLPLDPAIFAPAWQRLIGREIALRDLSTVLESIEDIYAFGTLPAAVFGLYGGEVFGRAYDPGALAGNNLVAASLQVTQQIDTGLRWLPELSLFAFADHGAAWNPAGSPYEFASLSSAGFGLRVGIGERLVATGPGGTAADI